MMNIPKLSKRLVPYLTVGMAVFTLWVTAVAAQEPAPITYQIQVNGLSCPFCAYGIEKQVTAIEGVDEIALDLKGGLLTVTMEEGAILEQLTASRAVERAGFTMGNFQQINGAKSTPPEE